MNFKKRLDDFEKKIDRLVGVNKPEDIRLKELANALQAIITGESSDVSGFKLKLEKFKHGYIS